MKFEYLQRVTVESELDVENIGECVIEANNDFGETFFLIIRTELGWTEVLEYGPCVPDLLLLHHSYQIKYNRFEYSEFKLEKIIDKFLNDSKRAITQAKVTDLNEIREFLVNPIDRLYNTGG